MNIDEVINWLNEREELKGTISMSISTPKITFKDEVGNFITLDFNGKSKDIIIKLENPNSVRLEQEL
jgi:hypothetical protein